MLESQLTDEQWGTTYEAILDLLDNEVFTGGDYDFMAGVFTVDDNRIVFEGSQTRDIYSTDIQL